MFYEENLAVLNNKLSEHRMRFENQGDNLILKEQGYSINDLHALKTWLQNRLKMRFNWGAKYWYIGYDGKKIIHERRLKLKPTKSLDQMQQELIMHIDRIVNQDLKNCIQTTLENNQYFYDCPAAKYYHHPYKNGLLEHTIQVIDISYRLATSLGDGLRINSDLIIAGSILHDIGKVNCYKFVDGWIDTCPIMSEQDHIINGIKIATEHVQCNHLDDLLHIIASHHKEKDYGSPISPISNEAWIINVADELSSKIMG